MDPSFLGVIFAASEKDNWTSPRVWAKANKSLAIDKMFIAITVSIIRCHAEPIVNRPAFAPIGDTHLDIH